MRARCPVVTHVIRSEDRLIARRSVKNLYTQPARWVEEAAQTAWVSVVCVSKTPWARRAALGLTTFLPEGGAGRGLPDRRAGASPVIRVVGAEDGWGDPATGPAPRQRNCRRISSPSCSNGATSLAPHRRPS